MAIKQCYRCGAPATSKEHVPPNCLFPEAKDVKFNFRRDLITVPSCDLHNTKKTKEDEFLLVCLAGNVGNNVVGYVQTKTKVSRALARKHKAFLNEVIRDAEELVLKADDGGEFPVLKGSPNHERLSNCFEHIAYGLFYHEHGRVFDGECRTLIGFLNYEEDRMNRLNELTQAKFEEETKTLPWKGANPVVFKYKFAPPDQFGFISLRIIFYGGTDVFTAFLPSGTAVPQDFAMGLIDAGIETSFHLDDKVIVFNKKKGN
jgi:hypothetical protein